MSNYCSECGTSLNKETSVTRSTVKSVPASKAKRKPSAYSLKYSKAFKSVKSAHMKKSGGWKKDGYKRAVKAAHKKAKGMR